MNLLFFQFFFALWTIFIAIVFPMIDAEFAEDLIAFMARVRLEN